MTRYSSDISDEELMQKASQGDRLAFAAIYDRWSERIFRFFRKMLWQNDDVAADFTQDLFLKIAEKPGAFNPQYRFSTWVYTLASNMCKNEYRKQSIRHHVNADDSGVSRSLADTGYENPERTVDNANFERKLQQTLGTLSEEHRTVFVLRYKEELSLKEIADVTQVSEGTVKSRLFYAIKKISEQVKDFQFD